MQQITPAAAGSARAQQAAGRFVINLMSSTTPMALAQPNHPQLKQFSFFITRRRQDRSERFRLHMGYFASQQLAEEMLIKVREIFPSAWAGMAPGNTEQKQAAERRAVAAAPYEVAHVPVATKSAVPAATGDIQPNPAVPVPTTAAPALAGKPAAPVTTAAAAAAVSAKPAATGTPATPSARPRAEHAHTVQSLQSVRAAIDALEDTSTTAQLRVLTVATAHIKPSSDPTTPAPTLSERQVMKVLEPTATGSRSLPDDKQRKDSKPQAPSAQSGKTPAQAPGGYTVQLMWAATPIDVANLPYLAIFEAYTLYIAEGTREGRRWYGLRLGFFNDGASAKQVAHYLRSEFSSVAVVPVSARERDRAKRATKALAPAAAPESAAGNGKRPEDYLLLDVEVATGLIPKAVAQQALIPDAVSRELADIGTEPVKTTPHKAPLTLEETLEILGANDMALQSRERELLSSSAVRAMRHAADAHVPEKRSALGKLFDRLGESLGR